MEKKTAFILFAVAVSLAATSIKQRNTIKNLKSEVVSLTKAKDSLAGETFVLETIIGRYELTMDHLKEENPKIGKELEEWMSHNTE